MANLAQIVNVLHAPIATRGASMWVTPTYHVFQLHAPHVGATSVRTDVYGPKLPNGHRAVSATSSIKDGAAAVTVTNRHLKDNQEIVLRLGGEAVSGRILVGDAANAENSASHPDRVKTVELEVQRGADGLTFNMPPHSVATVVTTS